MKQRYIYILSTFITILLVTSSLARAQSITPPHDDSNSINCLTCHPVKGSGVGLEQIPTDEDQELFCKECHNPEDDAAAQDKSNVANHVVNDGALIIDCGSCHNSHLTETSSDTHAGGTAAVNLGLVRSQIKKTDGVLLTAVFQESPEHFAFSEAPYNGICQTCHTSTDYYTNNSTPGAHPDEEGKTCTECHTHETGFLSPVE